MRFFKNNRLTKFLAAGGLAVLCLPAIPPAHAAASPTRDYTYRVLHKFKGAPDGANSAGGLVRGADGDLYGTSALGGDDAACTSLVGYGCGTVFRIHASKKEKPVYTLTGKPGPDGPYGTLLAEPDGSFYGLSQNGGATRFCDRQDQSGCGTVFRLDKHRKVTVIYSFGANGGKSDGRYPEGDLVQDSMGNLYGSTFWNSTIFEVTKEGVETVLYRFTGGADGSYPSRSLLRDASGNLYGTAGQAGGACGCGTVFKLGSSGTLTTLYTFQGQSDGRWPAPLGGLAADSPGNLYGVAQFAGDNTCDRGHGCGTVFRLSPSGVLTVLHTFEDGRDGRLPASRPLIDAQGNLYGTTFYGGGGCDCGVLYEITSPGQFRAVHIFKGNDGANPDADLFEDASGNIFGTTTRGGRLDLCPGGCGVVYEVSP